MLARRNTRNYNNPIRGQFEKLRGGSWQNGSQAGLFALNLNNSRLAGYDNVGFRSALACCSLEYLWINDCGRTKGNCFRPELIGDRLYNCAGAPGTILLVPVCST